MTFIHSIVCTCAGAVMDSPWKNIDSQYDNRCRNYNHGIYTKFIAHYAFLGFGRSNGGIGYKRQVVSKERTSDNNCHHEWESNLCLFG